ncbi:MULTISPECIES: SRPBCC family protein [Thioalkalivibrio]|uniref:Cyclase/dehydrase n=1 Tax=Thioalkalivibrio versutus TaxID=106634 RepID=A0A0G3G0H2_9GAMM|nr:MULTISPECIES: SRPBCC family protein [Thioalkalivibrio]AKJ94685.1 cyclase/dehydrase [Thioalkalivibrio versutus]
MRTISHSTSLRAEPDRVFELLSHVPNFVDLCDHVEHIERLGDDCYRWTIRAAGMRMGFDVEVCSAIAPEHFAWRSIRGIHNRGSYRLTPDGEGHTRVDFELEYKLNPILDAAVRRVAQSLVERVSGQLMDRAQQRLDAQAPRA